MNLLVRAKLGYTPNITALKVYVEGKKEEGKIMPSLGATTSALALKPCVRTHYIRTNKRDLFDFMPSAKQWHLAQLRTRKTRPEMSDLITSLLIYPSFVWFKYVTCYSPKCFIKYWTHWTKLQQARAWLPGNQIRKVCSQQIGNRIGKLKCGPLQLDLDYEEIK